MDFLKRSWGFSHDMIAIITLTLDTDSLNLVRTDFIETTKNFYQYFLIKFFKYFLCRKNGKFNIQNMLGKKQGTFPERLHEFSKAYYQDIL